MSPHIVRHLYNKDPKRDPNLDTCPNGEQPALTPACLSLRSSTLIPNVDFAKGPRPQHWVRVKEFNLS